VLDPAIILYLGSCVMGPENPQVVVDAPINFIIKLLRGQARSGSHSAVLAQETPSNPGLWFTFAR
jgi:hypothetical protein